MPFLPIPPPCTAQPSSSPPISSCPRVVHISSLSSVSYTIFYLSPSILCLLIMPHHPCTFPPTPPFPLPTENPPCDVHFSDFVPILVICLVFVFVVFFFQIWWYIWREPSFVFWDFFFFFYSGFFFFINKGYHFPYITDYISSYVYCLCPLGSIGILIFTN